MTEPVDEPKLNLIGRTPPPRVLFLSRGDQGHQLAIRFIDQIPTATAVDPPGFMEVWQAGFDLLVLLDVSFPPVEDRIHVLQIGGDFCGSFTAKDVITQVRRDGTSHADAWFIPDLPDDLEHLVRQDLLPLVPIATRAGTVAGTSKTSTLSMAASKIAYRTVANVPEDAVTSLVFDPSAKSFAAEVRRRPEGALHWILPSGANPDLWLSYVLRRLHQEAPAQFPMRTGWANVPEYQTPDERAARDRLAEIAKRRERLSADLRADEAKTAAELLAATQVAEDTERQLVTTQKRGLVDAVGHCLESLGFIVSDSDAGANPSQLLEDLQVSLPGQDTTALVEVRGYKGGAAVNDLARIYRFATNYAAEHSRVADRLWYIVNQFIGRVPADRPRPMTSHAADVEQFAKSGGLVIDTADLLELWLMIQRDDVSKEQARQMLWRATGVFALPNDELPEPGLRDHEAEV
ncbi:MAG: hypothetical protein M3Y42_12325 [Actinomycetota bacterium]|nr:hypothetical protein [Actinomycetota bacterium]MDQ2957739.1 hypothetical protein [Actinomycetota bacterium]